jgi:hypothetical protein
MTPIHALSLTLVAEGRFYPLTFPVRRVVNAGYVGRDRAAVEAHIEELSREGIPPPATVPALYPLSADNVTTSDQIEVIGRSTSGEVEYVLLLDQDEVFVGIGSDHTDRDLERQSIDKSKQVCKNVLSKQVWRYRDVKDYWDDLVIRSWVRWTAAQEEVLYQQASLGAIISAEDLIELIRSRLADRCCDGLVIYSGTFPVLTGKIQFHDCFRGELFDPRSERRLIFAYRAAPLEYLQSGAE